MEKLTDESIMPFGKYKGKALANVPAKDLIWYYENLSYLNGTPLETYIEENLEVLKAEVKRNKRC